MCVLDILMTLQDVLWMSTNLLKMCSKSLYRSVALLRCCLLGEAVADAGDGQDKTWSLEDRLDFLAQLRHIDMEAMCFGMCIGPPNLFQQHLARENLAAVGDEDLEQVVFGGRQGDLPPINLHPPPCEIDGERACLKPRLGTARWLDHATQNDPHARQHLLHAEGLGDVVIRPQVERFNLVAFGVLHREHDNGHVRHCPNPPTYLKAAHAR